MKALVIFSIILAVYLSSAFNMRATGNDTLQQQQEKKAEVYSRIYNGKRATDSLFPYQVGLRIYSTNTEYGICGGSLIGLNWVLTAAHCVEVGIKVTVHIGRIEFGQPHVEIPINSHDIIKHKEYNETTLRQDIAVIRIPSVTLSREIELIHLPEYDGNVDSYFDAQVVLAGWGHTSESSTTTSSVLLYATYRVIQNMDCANAFGTLEVYPGKLCTVARRSSACVGDSGSPLVRFIKDHPPIQIGLLSFVVDKGCKGGHPNGFTRVDYYLRWIRKKTGLQV